jgi:DNA-binding NarL/FixJ family response regulator
MCGREGQISVSIVVSGMETGGAAAMSNGLSEREQAALSWLKHGLPNKEIGLALSISPRTVQKHLQRVYQQLGVQTRAEAIVRIHRQARRSCA